MGIGLLAAGVSSALTAPLAAAYAAKGLFGWEDGESSLRFRSVWMVILLIGVVVAVTNVDRIHVIYFAQVTNALLLPFIAGYLLYICNSRRLMGDHTNTLRGNILAGVVILLCIGLSIKSIFTLIAS
jgi:Mn2+/Fe2+ NRAMP family transporter